MAIDEDLVEAALFAYWADQDECTVEQARDMFIAGKGAPHQGDCTDEARTCRRCLYDSEMASFRAALTAILPVVEERERERAAKVAGERADRLRNDPANRDVVTELLFVAEHLRKGDDHG